MNPFNRLWSHRWLLLIFFQREIKNRYVGSVSGMFWALINPVALLAVYAMVFQYIFKVKFPELGGHGFIAFVAVALWPWMAFQEGVQRGMLAVQNGADLVKKAAFPHEVMVYGAILATFAVHMTGMLFVVLVLALTGTLDIQFAALPLVVLTLMVLLILCIGFTLVLAALQTLLKDVEHFMAPLFMVWFYATPILYPASLVPAEIRRFIELNPLSFFMGRLRDGLLHGQAAFHFADVLTLLLVLLMFICGWWFFNRLSPVFEDFL